MRFVILLFVGIAIGLIAARAKTPDTVDPAQSEVAPRANPGPRPTWIAAVNEQLVPQRELQPTDARYNAVAMLQESQGELSVKEIYEAEPRDSAFAPVLEKRIADVLTTMFRDLNLTGAILGIQTSCKTLSCSTRIEVEKAEASRVYESINGILLGDVQSPSIDETDPQKSYVVIDNLYRPDSRDETYYQRFLREAVWPAVELVKKRQMGIGDEAPR